ncbi:Alpha-terpineol synthase, chloroplastic [Linum grandiflorum]
MASIISMASAGAPMTYRRQSSKLPSPLITAYNHPPHFLKPAGRLHQSSSGRRIHAVLEATSSTEVVERRSGNYGPNIWKSTQYSMQHRRDDDSDSMQERVEELKKYVKHNLLNADIVNGEDGDRRIARLVETIDKVQRLGIGYHFEDEIESVLAKLSSMKPPKGNLHVCSLWFRLLRQAGIRTSPDVFEGFKDDTDDVKGLISLYEASYLGTPDETVLDDARSFAREHLHALKNKKMMSPKLANQLERTLNLPCHWRTQRSEARWLIEQYQDNMMMNEGDEDMDDSALLELAILDFNMVQLVYQSDLLELNRWWKELGLPEKLDFARDRLMESFQWAVGLGPDPQFSNSRMIMTKLIALINVIDDVYDVYGSLDELELFTAAIERWDANGLDRLPKYMQICFMAVYNTTNELAYHTLKQQDFNCLPYIKQAWQEQCGLYLEEAKTFHTVGSHQTFEEYLEVGHHTIGSRIVLIHTYAASGVSLTEEAFDYLANYPDLSRWIATICRLTNDLATSKTELERGDILKSVECYMKENDVTEKEAREYIEWRIDETWKNMNRDVMSNYGHMKVYTNQVVNFSRACHFMYHNGDAHGKPTQGHKDRAMALLFQPFSVPAAMEKDNTP